MTVKQIGEILRSPFGGILNVAIFSNSKMEFVTSGSAEYIVKNYGDIEISRIAVDENETVVLVTD